MPTATGFLHLGHLGGLCVINSVAKEKGKPAGFVIDDIQINNWGMYDRNFSEEEIKIYCDKIVEIISFLFPEMKFLGRFTDQKYEDERIKFYEEYDKVEFNFSGRKYSIPRELYSVSSNGWHLFDVLKCFYKTGNNKEILWNPYYSHEMVDKTIGTTCQIVDYNLFCPHSYLYDNHINTRNYYLYWGKVVGRGKYDVMTYPRILSGMGEDIRKSELNNDYSLYPLCSVWEKASIAYGVEKKNACKMISDKLLNSQSIKPIRIRNPLS